MIYSPMKSLFHSYPGQTKTQEENLFLLKIGKKRFPNGKTDTISLCSNRLCIDITIEDQSNNNLAIADFL